MYTRYCITIRSIMNVIIFVTILNPFTYITYIRSIFRHLLKIRLIQIFKFKRGKKKYTGRTNKDRTENFRRIILNILNITPSWFFFFLLLHFSPLCSCLFIYTTFVFVQSFSRAPLKIRAMNKENANKHRLKLRSLVEKSIKEYWSSGIG